MSLVCILEVFSNVWASKPISYRSSIFCIHHPVAFINDQFTIKSKQSSHE